MFVVECLKPSWLFTKHYVVMTLLGTLITSKDSKKKQKKKPEPLHEYVT